MTATPSPDPFPPIDGFEIIVAGGVPPYTYTPRLSPPNPPGVTVDGNHVNVPVGTPGGTPVFVVVTDSSNPPQQTVCVGHVV